MALRSRFPIRCQALWIVLLARELQSPGYSVDTVTHATMPQAVDGLRNSSTTVMRRMLASIKSVEEVLGGGLLLLRHYHAKNRESGMVVCKLLILRRKNSFSCCDRKRFLQLAANDSRGKREGLVPQADETVR